MRIQHLILIASGAALAACASSEVEPAADQGRVPVDMAAAGGAGGTGGGGGGRVDAGVGGQGGQGGAPGCADADRDGYEDARCNPDPAMGGGDCDDQNNLVNPGRRENCANRRDNDCNGIAPPEDPACGGGPCADLDGDGFQDAACNEDRASGGDCDDTNPNVNPGVGERCGNGRDDDCADGDIPCLQNCVDMDLDGFGEGSGCRGPDCNDRDARVNPWRTEICGDGVDQDCRGGDLACNPQCMDADRDGFGQGQGCRGIDCNDMDPDINPGAREIPGDGIDQDCNGADLVLGPNCIDRDQDGHGEGADCVAVDCDDTNPRVHTNRTEICGNGVDDDCRGGDQPCIGMGTGECIDNDGDGFGDGGCRNGNFDCNDNDPGVNPFMAEVCDGQDNNCDGEVDECPIRNQVCDLQAGACVGQVGAPCREDNNCAISQGLTCDRESGECRLGPGAPCDDDAQCDPTAVCEDLSGICEDGPSCYRVKGGACQASCDCADIYLCNGNQRCVECLNDGQCDQDARDTCTDGGFCTQETTIGGAGNDARYQLFRRLVACWEAFAEDNEAQGCDVLLTEAELFVAGAAVNGVGGAEDLEDDACDADALGAAGFDGDARDVLAELFGCGLFDLWNIWWQAPVRPNEIGDTCIYYAPKKSGFGFPDDTRAAIVLAPCDVSAFE
ncbi:MAG: hypothetical protein H6702_00750 [Myxococcales bacterium]|nr:hypothetical protein [Myxococcales bacterium]